jgi:hypothetical protein
LDASIPEVGTPETSNDAAVDASYPTDSGGSEGGDAGSIESGSSEGGFAACSASTRIDTLRGVDGATDIGVAVSGNKIAYVWYQDYQLSMDGQVHLKARIFDGSALLDEVDLGVAQWAPGHPGIDVDGAGHGFLQWWGAGAMGQRSVFDFATFGAATTFASPAGSMSLAPIASGGALSVYDNGMNALAAKWDPSGSAWQDTGLLAPTSLQSLTVNTNAAGKGVAAGYQTTGITYTLTATAFDGMAWGTPSSLTFGGDAGSAGVPFEHAFAVTSGGDALFLLGFTDKVQSVRFHAAGQWDAPVTVDTMGGSSLRIVVDSMDRATAVWLRASGTDLYASRDLGSGWGAPQDLGPSGPARVDLDPASNVVVTALPVSLHFVLIRAGAGDASWSPPVDTGLVSANVSAFHNTRVAFGASGTVFAALQPATDVDSGIGYELRSVVCN